MSGSVLSFQFWKGRQQKNVIHKNFSKILIIKIICIISYKNYRNSFKKTKMRKKKLAL